MATDTNDLTRLSDDELAAYRQAADEDIELGRAKKRAARDEWQRREDERLIAGMSPGQLERINQAVANMTAGEQGKVGGNGAA